MLLRSAASILSPYFAESPAQLLAMLETPPHEEMGDVSLPCFAYAKIRKQAPQAIAEQIAERVNADRSDVRAVTAGGYLNLFFQGGHWRTEIVERALDADYGRSDIGQGKRVVIDMSSPNIAKPFSIGHLRSTMIGNALVHLYRATGHKVVNVNHIGDWGTQFGKLIVAYLKWGDKAVLDREPIRESLRLYVEFHQQAELDPGLEDEAREAFAKLEQGDAETRELWQYFIDESMKEFQRVYERLGVSFDSYAGESFYNDKIAPVVSKLEDLSLLEEDDGARIVRLEELNLPPCLVLKKDGSTIYAVRDLATAIYRKDVLGADEILYVVGAEQSLHFQQVFSVLGKMGYDWASGCRHIPFGLMTFGGKKMSTRRGKVVFLEEVLDEATDRALRIIDAKNPGLAGKEAIAEAVGVGAIIFGDLKHHRQLSVDFDLEEAVSFDGETGPYLQYAHARICTLLEKGNYEKLLKQTAVDGTYLSSDSAWACIKTLSRYEAAILEAVRLDEPFVVAKYLLSLAKDFNRFYNSGKILADGVSDAEIISKLSLSAAVANVLKQGLNLLGIQAPSEM
ncbi:arginine--tRNA ligase [Cohnella terricola]|uniref:Arginine--tRNA ligase n=1 Tax=Cohnella terricola TaxID=1289167 RepID=A0A559JAB6_9BACL|nr:arginine--tRNA ligase [Cohnella terricola]TVX96838.1 arginine--tRNA ligase [Cohnella terricola]